MNHETYRAAREGCAWRDMNHFGRFRVAGAESPQLLHHLTTNDIKGLKPESGCDAALVSSKARLLDLLWVFRRPDEFFVITSPNRREMFKPHAQQFILFRQDVRIEDVSGSGALWGIFGPQSERVLQNIGFAPDANVNAIQMVEKNGAAIFAARTWRLPLNGLLLWSENKETLAEAVLQSKAPQCDNETYNTLRIEAGIPVAGPELTEDINPWEANLSAAISLHKGCYNGQEVIARLNTYKKVKQRLCGLKLQSAVEMGTRANLRSGTREAGFVTSSVQSPRFGPIALAYVRGDFATAGQQLELVINEQLQSATVVDLPFTG